MNRLSAIPEEERMLRDIIVGYTRDRTTNEQEPITYTIGQYCCTIYDGEWCVGMITSYDKDNDDYQIRFMHQTAKSNNFIWPRRDDVCWVTEGHIVCGIGIPALRATARSYHIDEESFTKVQECKSM